MELFIFTWGIFLCVVVILVSVVFLISQARQDNGLMDIAYGPIFAVSGWATWYFSGAVAEPLPLVVLGFVSLWAMRLAIRIGRKNLGKPEDVRYAAWRSAWMKEGPLYFIIRSYLQVNLLQGLVITVVGLPMVVVVAAGTAATFSPLSHFGILIFLFGISYEALADYQLDLFLSRKRAGAESAALMTTGLFKFSRRPNYFGESLVWLGLALTTLSLPFGYIAFLSPFLITYIVTKVTGPMLENIFLERYPQEYCHYMSTTNYFIPGRKKQSVNFN